MADAQRYRGEYGWSSNSSHTEDGAKENGEPADGIIVRMGGQVWRMKDIPWRENPEQSIEENYLKQQYPLKAADDAPEWIRPQKSPTRLLANDSQTKKPIRSPEAHRGWKDAFRTGLMVGIGLGCLFMVLFHQVATGKPTGSTAAAQNSPSKQDTSAAAALATAGTMSSDNLLLTIPSIQFNILEQGPYTSLAHASQVAASPFRGVNGIVTGAGPYQVWWAASLTGKGLSDDIAATPAKNVRVKPIVLTASKIGLAVSLDLNERSQLNQWFAAELSGLRTLTGALQGELTSADAVQAVQNARQFLPSESLLSTPGIPGELKVISQDVDAASKALASGKEGTAENSVVDAWQKLTVLRTSTPS